MTEWWLLTVDEIVGKYLQFDSFTPGVSENVSINLIYTEKMFGALFFMYQLSFYISFFFL